ncbi:hypothetical protein SLEP1_g19632 [Rubroshorea leprosula]|uniref:Uncharacterized protein n=1 Tax=Rubroshorea leprosula TaxID=152421 RepID=A0AAV5J620_9ROSI|nr:hypothetical protein SLEP1_g19632 [Rubroshorea leprosula]
MQLKCRPQLMLIRNQIQLHSCRLGTQSSVTRSLLTAVIIFVKK